MLMMLTRVDVVKVKEYDIDLSSFSSRLEFSTMHRKALIEDLEVCYNSDMMARTSEMSTLSVSFSEDTDNTSLDGCRHPVEQYFHRLPEPVRKYVDLLTINPSHPS
jgi:hypothetical protein